MDHVVALVLARGLGTRMRDAASEGAGAGLTSAQAAAAAAGHKGLMPLVDRHGQARPFLDFVLHHLAEAGFTDVGLVVPPPPAPGAPDPLRDYYTGAGRPTRLTLTLIVQPEARGTADAVVAADHWLAGRPFVVVNADNLYAIDDLRALRRARGPALPVYERDALVARSGIPPERVGAFALLTVAPDGHLLDIVEKPGPDAVAAAGGRALISMNCWRGDAALVAACRDVPLSPRGEFELPAAVRLALSRGVRFDTIPAVGPVFDLSRRSDVPAMAERLRGMEVRP